MEMLELIKKGESDTLEFKEKPNEDVTKYLKTVSAFANGSGGVIIFGISDDGCIVGVKGDFSKLADQLTDCIVQEVVPAFLFTIDPFVIDGKHLLILKVNHGPETPYYLRKEGVEQGTYIRINSTTRRCSQEVLKDLMILGQRKSPDMIEIIGEFVLEEDPCFKELCTFASDKSHKEISSTQLCNMGLVRNLDGRLIPTIGYSLLTDNPYNHARIECGKFRGNDRSIFLDKATFGGPLYIQIEKAARFVLDNLKMNVRIDGIYRKEEPEVPLEAIRELITNAVVHRSYQMETSPIFVGVYDDIVEIISPGLLPDGMTVEDALRGSRRHRNRALGEFFIAVGLMEGWGSGLNRAFKMCLAHGLAEPRLETLGENIRIIIYRRGIKPHDTGSILPLNDLDKSVLVLLETDGTLTIPKIAEKLDVSGATVNKVIKRMKDSGRLIREGSNKNGRWVVRSRV